jgi:hypothetical protein
MGRRYTRSPEPYRDPPPPEPPRCGAQNPLQLACEQAGDLSTEFSWGQAQSPRTSTAGHCPRAASTCPARHAWTRHSVASVGPGSTADHPTRSKGYAGDQVAP